MDLPAAVEGPGRRALREPPPLDDVDPAAAAPSFEPVDPLLRFRVAFCYLTPQSHGARSTEHVDPGHRFLRVMLRISRQASTRNITHAAPRTQGAARSAASSQPISGPACATTRTRAARRKSRLRSSGAAPRSDGTAFPPARGSTTRPVQRLLRRTVGWSALPTVQARNGTRPPSSPAPSARAARRRGRRASSRAKGR